MTTRVEEPHSSANRARLAGSALLQKIKPGNGCRARITCHPDDPTNTVAASAVANEELVMARGRCDGHGRPQGRKGKRTNVGRRFHLCYLLATGLLAFGCVGCTYRLYAPVAPSEERIKVVAKSLDHYVLHIEEHVPTVNSSQHNDAPRIRVAHATNYVIPSDGLVSIRVPSYRPYCGVYVFNLVKVGGGGDDALKDWEVSVLSGMRALRVLSLKQIRELPTDPAGYRLLKIPD